MQLACSKYLKNRFQNDLIKNCDNISLIEIDFEDTLKKVDPNMTENIQPRILIVNNIYIKDHADNDTHGRYNCCAFSRKISVTEIKLIHFS